MKSGIDRHQRRRLILRPTLHAGEIGFTVAESLMVIAAGALLLSLGIPGISTIARNAAQATSSNELLSTLQYARELAITRNMRMTVCPSATATDCEPIAWNHGWIVFEDLDGDRSVDAGEIVERVGAELRDLSLTTSEFESVLIFRPNGRAMGADIRNNSGEFTLCDERGASSARVVIIDTSGRAKASRTTSEGIPPGC